MDLFVYLEIATVIKNSTKSKKEETNIKKILLAILSLGKF